LETKTIQTTDFLKKIKDTKSITEYIRKLDEIPDVPDFAEHLDKLRIERNIKKEHLFMRSGISQTYGHEIFRGIKHTSRDKILQFAIGLGLDVDDTQELLKIGRHAALYPKVKRDAIICHAIANEMDIVNTNALLNDTELIPLGDL
jgi:transcriptional regulator with XRE-family HTH domain